MQDKIWFKNFPGAIIAADAAGVVIDMNDRSAESYKNKGGYNLIGKSAIDCHHGESLEKARAIWNKPDLNVFTVTKNGKKKLVYQTPFFEDGKFTGMVELVLPLPDGEIPHYERR